MTASWYRQSLLNRSLFRAFRASRCRSVPFSRSMNAVLIARLTFDIPNAKATAAGASVPNTTRVPTRTTRLSTRVFSTTAWTKPSGATRYGGRGRTRLARPGWHHRGAIGPRDRRLIGGIVVAGHQVQQPTSGPAMSLLDQRFGVFDRPGSGDHAKDQAAFRIQGDMIPEVSLGVVGRVATIAMGFLLADIGPLLVKLDLGGEGEIATSSS